MILYKSNIPMPSMYINHLRTHQSRKEKSRQAQQQTQRRENATDDNSDERENYEVIWCVFIIWRLVGNYGLQFNRTKYSQYCDL